MKLYHYANSRFNDLRTLEKQRAITDEEKQKALDYALKENKPGFYYEHVSFFFEPIPLDKLSGIFPKDHAVWFSGNEIFQYAVESKHIGDFKYEIVEFPEKTELYYDDDLSISDYHLKLKEAIEANHYIGHNQNEFEKAARHLVGQTERYFLGIKKRPNYDEIKYKYAATVPHVMLYPDKGIIKYDDISLEKIK